MLSATTATITTLVAFPILSFGQMLGTPASEQLLSAHQISLEDRQSAPYLNQVFKDNILLNLAYMDGKMRHSRVTWDQVEQPFHYELAISPGYTFAFHDDVLPQFRGKVIKTAGAHFNLREGFKSDGYLVGDGICHLASLIYWVAKDAQISAYAPTNHNFANIPEVPREYGVAIYHFPGQNLTSESQNLYITNNYSTPVTFKFDFDGHNLKVAAYSKS